MNQKPFRVAILIFFAGLYPASRVFAAPPLPGYVVHFDFLENAQEGRDMVRIAKAAGARVINLVPPAHVWEVPEALSALDEIVDEIDSRHLKFVITRVDAAFPQDRNGVRKSFLYADILNRPGRLPDGSPTVDWFLSTVGIPSYEQWMQDETRFYAKRYGSSKSLIGFNVGPFSEPFVSQRGGFLQYVTQTNKYEITQYTPEMEAVWHQWLAKAYQTTGAANAALGVHFDGWGQFPMPKSETDDRFGKPDKAYSDFVRSINDWFVDQYEACRKIWHEEAERKDIPFILQFSGFDDEKFELGRAAYAGFNRKDWVSRADAVGLSIYTNGGYKDFGRSSIESLIRKLGGEWNLGKPVFVLEGGCENPYPVLDKEWLHFYATAARTLHPVTYIYEFLKDPFYVQNEPNSGRILTQEGDVRKDAYKYMKRLMSDIEKNR